MGSDDNGYSTSWLTICLLAIWFFLLPAFVMSIVALARATNCDGTSCGCSDTAHVKADGTAALSGGTAF